MTFHGTYMQCGVVKESKLQEGQSTEEVFKASLGRGRALNVLVRAPGASATR